jgi:tRNA threonylcarbamoyladenosine biosynthesis protein TsaB
MSNLEPNLEQPLILVADTSSSRASLGIGQGAQLLGLFGLATDEKRSSHLLADIDRLLSRLDRRIQDVDLFGVLTGPGSFTGLRVGLATIKGFAHAGKKSIAGMTTLETIARACGPSVCTCSLINAYRGEVFAQLFSVSDVGEVLPLSEAIVAKLESVLAAVYDFQKEHKIGCAIFSGDGACLHAEEIARLAAGYGIPFQKAKLLTLMQAGWILHSLPDFLAADAVLYAYEKYLRGEAVEANQIAAYYIRPAEAEIKLKLGLIGKKAGDR